MITFFSIIVVSLIIFYYEYTLIVGVLLGLLIYKIIHEIYKYFHRKKSKILFSGGLFQDIMSKKDLESLREFILSKNPKIIEYQIFIISDRDIYTIPYVSHIDRKRLDYIAFQSFNKFYKLESDYSFNLIKKDSEPQTRGTTLSRVIAYTQGSTTHTHTHTLPGPP